MCTHLALHQLNTANGSAINARLLQQEADLACLSVVGGDHPDVLGS